MRLHERRSSGGFGVSPITWPDIDAFTRLSGVRLTSWEIEIIEDLDSVFLMQQSKEAQERANKGK